MVLDSLPALAREVNPQFSLANYYNYHQQHHHIQSSSSSTLKVSAPLHSTSQIVILSGDAAQKKVISCTSAQSITRNCIPIIQVTQIVKCDKHRIKQIVLQSCYAYPCNLDHTIDQNHCIVMQCFDIVMKCFDIVMECIGILMECFEIVMECFDREDWQGCPHSGKH